jgi:hypothetical protein
MYRSGYGIVWFIFGQFTEAGMAEFGLFFWRTKELLTG